MKNAFKTTIPTSTLEELCTIKAGQSVARAKKDVEEGKGRKVKVLLPKAMSGGRVNPDELAEEEVGNVKDEYYTREGDVVLKLSTPYDAAFIEADSADVLITSFGMVLRSASDRIDMRYLTMYLNTSMVADYFAARSSGSAGVKLIRLADVKGLEVPLPPLSVQRELAELDHLTRERAKRYRDLIDLDRELVQSQFLQTVLE